MTQSLTMVLFAFAALGTPCLSSNIDGSCASGDCQQGSIDDDVTMLQVKIERHTQSKMVENATAYYNDDSIRPFSTYSVGFNCEAGIEKGKRIILWGIPHGPITYSNMQFEVRGHPDNTIRPKSKPELCLNAASGDLKNGDQILLWPCQGAKNEKFYFDAGTSTIRAAYNTNMCMNAAGGGLKQGDAIILWGCGDQPAPNSQFVYMESIPTMWYMAGTTTPFLDGTWYLVYPGTATKDSSTIEISGDTLTLTKGWNVGGNYSLSDFATTVGVTGAKGGSFSISGNYGGGSANYWMKDDQTFGIIYFKNGWKAYGGVAASVY